MAVTNSFGKNSEAFIKQLSKDYSQFEFQPGPQEHWSARQKMIIYNPKRPEPLMQYGLLHELAHALLGHISYASDFELLKMESQAWQLAAEIGQKYGITIDDDHIQNCLDTYRDWLHRRSTCPKCGLHVLQQDSRHYRCYNCQAVWRVSSQRFSRPYRKTRS